MSSMIGKDATMIKNIKKIFCKLGIHMLENHVYSFYDNIGMQPVYRADCSCGKQWLDSTTFPIGFFSKVERDHYKVH